MDIMNLNNLFLTIAQGDLLRSQDQIILRNMVHLSLLKCGNVEMESMIDQGDLSPGIHWEKLTLFVENIFSAEPRTQRVRDLTHDGCHDLQRVAPFYRGLFFIGFWDFVGLVFVRSP